MDDRATSSIARGPALANSACEGNVYVLDLADFSKLTERAITDNVRLGIEAVSRRVTGFFTSLSSQFTDYGIQYGGFAGDALIASQLPGGSPLGQAGFISLAAACAARSGTDLRFRVGLAQGAFHLISGRSGPTFLTGPAVTTAFRNLKGSTVHAAGPSDVQDRTRPDPGVLASASVGQRWSIVARLLGSQACDVADADQLRRATEMCEDICDAFGGVLENVTQDDKGLLAILVPRRSGPGAETDHDAFLRELTRALGTLDGGGRAISAYGTIFQCRPFFSGERRLVSFGAPLNQAAKALQDFAEPQPHPTARRSQLGTPPPPRLVGREQELARLERAAEESLSDQRAACLVGPGGIGKSAILRQFLKDSGKPALQLDLTPVDRHIPLGCALQLARMCELDARLFQTPEGLARLQGSLPERLVIENWHWCDEESRRIVNALWQGRESGLLICTSRNAVDLPGQAGEDRCLINVDALSSAAAAELVNVYASSGAGSALDPTLLELLGGNPFWIIQAALHTAAGQPEDLASASAGGLDALLSARARDLSPTALTLWRLHCAWRNYLPERLAEDILSTLGFVASPDDLGQLTSLGWLEASPQGESAGNRPVHDILADWGVSDLPASFEKNLNMLIARQLIRLKMPEARIAKHWLSAGEPLRASVFYERAAVRACELGAFTSCLENLDQARKSAGTSVDPVSRRNARHLSLSAAATWGGGRLRRAAQVLKQFDQTVNLLPKSKRLDSDRLRVAFVRSEVGQFSGNTNLILSGLVEGARLSLQATDSQIARARRASFLYYLIGLARLPTRSAFDRLISEAAGRSDPRSEVSLRLSSATLHMSCCRWRDAALELRSAKDAASRTDDIQMIGTALTLAALCDLFQGNSQGSFDHFQQLEQLSGLQDHQIFSVWSAYGMGESHYYAGDLTAAQAGVELAAQRRPGLGDHQSSCIIEGLAAQIAFQSGEDDVAERRARNALRFGARLPPSNFSTLEGIAAPAEIGAKLIQRRGPSDSRSELVSKGLKALRTYALPFALARPRLALVEGHCLEAAERRRPAARKYARAAALATQFGMDFERKLADRALARMETDSHG